MKAHSSSPESPNLSPTMRAAHAAMDRGAEPSTVQTLLFLECVSILRDVSGMLRSYHERLTDLERRIQELED